MIKRESKALTLETIQRKLFERTTIILTVEYEIKQIHSNTFNELQLMRQRLPPENLVW